MRQAPDPPFPDYVLRAYAKQGKKPYKPGEPKRGETFEQYTDRTMNELIDSVQSLLPPEAKEVYDRSLPGIFEQVGLNPDGTPKEKT